MIKPLIWKEWREQRWKLAFGTVMLAFFTGSLLAARISNDREIVVVIWIIGGWILSLYSAIGVFATEISDGTKMFLVSKPAQPWKSFLCKWFFGWLNFAVPMLVCSGGLVIVNLLNPNEGWDWFELKTILEGTLRGICFGTMFYSMTCFLAPKKSSQAITGFVGLIIFVIMFCYCMTFLFFTSHHDSGELSLIGKIAFYINPVILLPNGSPWGPQFLEQSILFIFVMLIGFRKWQRSI